MIAFSFERGDTAYLCYTDNTGWMWMEENHACPVRVLEKTSSSYRIQAERDCYFRKWIEDDVFWVDSSELYARTKSDCGV